MELTLIHLAESPWVFGLILILTIVTAVQPLWRIGKFCFLFANDVFSKRSKQAGSFVRRRIALKVELILRNERPYSIYFLMLFEWLTLLASALVLFAFLVIALNLENYEVAQAALGKMLGLPIDVSFDAPMLFGMLSAITLNLFVLVNLTLFNLLVFRLVAEFGERDLQDT